MRTISILLLNVFLLFILACSNEDVLNEETIVNTNDFVVDFNEFPENGQVIGVVQASTNRGNLTFSIISQTPNEAFTLNSLTGELKVLNKILFNFDTNPTISGIVEVRNGDIIDHSRITINVKNVERVFNGSVNIQTQIELENFASNNYDRVNGSIMLMGATIVKTDNLNSIKFIDGNIIIVGTKVENIDGFTNANVSNDATIQIVNNQNLENLNGLKSVTNRLMSLDISNNPLINSIDGLKGISNVTNYISISDSNHITNLDGLSEIKNPIKYLSIGYNSALINTEGLSNIPSIFSFSFSNNDLATSLSNMSSLVEVDFLFLNNNDKLENIDGLFELETCKNLTIQNNVSLKNLNGLIKLKNVNDGSMRITGNASLKDFCGLSLISTISPVGYNIRDNFYNPTKEDIKNGNCSI